MNNNFYSKVVGSVLLVFCLVFPQVTDAQEEYKTVRFMTYNVCHCSGMDDVINPKRTADVIKALSPDVVAIQELDSVTSRSSNVDQLKQLSNLARMRNYYYAKAISYGGGGYGVGILSKEKALSVKKIPLPGEEARVLLVVEFEDYVYACAHFDLKEEMRLKSVDPVVNEMKRWNKPFVFAGDWNDTPNSTFITQLEQNLILFNDSFTFPADTPTICIDYIATYKNSYPAELVKSWVPENDKESDHRPLVADLKIPLSTGVSNVTKNQAKVVVKGNTLSFTGTTEQDVVSVSTTNAMTVIDRIAPQDIKLTPGVYIVKINDEPTKVYVGK